MLEEVVLVLLDDDDAEVGERDDDDRGRFRLRKDIFIKGTAVYLSDFSIYVYNVIPRGYICKLIC